ncbi:MAG: non-homologous end-joining DNA ligase, partial [Solirubrobacteraceae bacterium]|nr:non-homologous end-joining DNA ligase [Solirubrobacteraceae bacterium]
MQGRLDDYRRKRRFDETPEPSDSGTPSEGPARFVIHEHHATRLHWDLRLEHDGVLASWAVPNGIPRDPKRNRKAIQTEDHPLAYLEFAGTIPAGNYGAGEISIWDHGTYVTEKWRKDEIIVVFAGERLRGKYVLFQAGKEGSDWLLHRMDPPQDPGAEPIPDHIAPMLAVPGDLPARQDEWAFEVKWDGVRALARSEPGRLHLFGRSGREITASYPELAALNRQLSSHEAVLDGEIIAFDEHGKQSFSSVQHRIQVTDRSAAARLARENPVTYMIFDLLWLDGHSLVDLPYEERRTRLEALGLAGGPNWDVPAFHVGAGTELLAATAEQELEGIIAKRLGSAYEPGARAQNWRKIKHTRRQEVVIAGISPGRGNRTGSFGALQCGVYSAAGELSYCGGVGTGFTDAMLREVLRATEGLEVDDTPFAGTKQPPKGTRFLAPELVCEVEFAEWSRDGSLRHPTFRGLRFDRDARDVIREEQGVLNLPDREPTSRPVPNTQAQVEPETKAERAPAPASEGPEETPEAVGASLDVEGHTVKLTNLGKVLYPVP